MGRKENNMGREGKGREKMNCGEQEGNRVREKQGPLCTLAPSAGVLGERGSQAH